MFLKLSDFSRRLLDPEKITLYYTFSICYLVSILSKTVSYSFTFLIKIKQPFYLKQIIFLLAHLLVAIRRSVTLYETTCL